MADDFLKGNYIVKKQIKEEEILIDEKEKLKKELKGKALASLGGSMVYVERDKLNWDGAEIEEKIEKK